MTAVELHSTDRDERDWALTDHDIYLFKQGAHTQLYRKMGARCVERDARAGVSFAVWAPNARRVSVIADFTAWRPHTHELAPRQDHSGIWEGFFTGIDAGACYKYRIESPSGDFEKGDPFALLWEAPPRTASKVWRGEYAWRDTKW